MKKYAAAVFGLLVFLLAADGGNQEISAESAFTEQIVQIMAENGAAIEGDETGGTGMPAEIPTETTAEIPTETQTETPTEQLTETPGDIPTEPVTEPPAVTEDPDTEPPTEQPPGTGTNGTGDDGFEPGEPSDQTGENMTEEGSELLTWPETETTEDAGETEDFLTTEFPTEFENESDSELTSEWESETETESETEAEARCDCGNEEKEALLHDFSCPVFQKKLREICGCGENTGEIEEHLMLCDGVHTALEARCNEECGAYALPAAMHWECDALRALEKKLCTCGISNTDFTEHKEECEYYLYMEDCAAYCNSQVNTAADIPSKKLPYSGSGFSAVTSSTRTHAEYLPVRFYSGISSMSLWGTAGSNLIRGKWTSDGTASGTVKGEYWYPKKDGLQGTYGARYSKVSWDNGQWYDLLITVSNYTSSVVTTDNKSHTAYPEATFANSIIQINFDRGGILGLKFQIVKTGTNTAVKKKIRLNFTDIDDRQVVGFKISGGGSVDYKYVMPDSIIYHDTGKTLAGISGMERLVGDKVAIDTSDHHGDAIYELNTSECYVALGHANTDAVAWSTIKKRQQKCIDGVIGARSIIQIKTASTITPTTPGTPKKEVSNDKKTWSTSNQLSKSSQNYYYRITQQVPVEFETYYYSKFVISDILPKGVDYAGEMAVTRAEDGKNVTSQFDFGTADDVITATAKSSALSTSGFYGYTYYFTFKVKPDTTETKAAESNGELIYTFSNTAKAAVRHKTETSDTSLQSGKVTTTLTAVRAVTLKVTKINKETKENIKNVQFEVLEWNGSYYATSKGMLTYSASGNCYTSGELARTQKNQGKYKVVEKTTPKGYVGSWSQEVLVPTTEGVVELNYQAVNEMAKGTIQLKKTDEKGAALAGAIFEITAKNNITSPEGKVLVNAGAKVETLTCDKNGTAVSSALYLGTYTVKETQAPAGYVKSTETKEVTLAWKDANTKIVNSEVTFANKKLQAEITLQKEIDAQDIVWAHGNPTFLFCLRGTDVFGKEHTYYRMVEFTKNNTDASGSGKVRLKAVFTVPAGKYTATEGKTVRYALSQIYEVTGGQAGAAQAEFDLSTGGSGSAVFYNRKTTDAGASHTSLVSNSFF